MVSWFDPSRTRSFAFTFTVGPQIKFCFDQIVGQAAKASNRPFKRRRPLWDVDGGTSEGKKKRRLRLNLITSRLSRPFSAPATNIAHRGVSRIAVWAKGKRLDKSLLRKAAIVNSAVRAVRYEAAKAMAVRRDDELLRQEIAAGLRRQVLVAQNQPRIYDAPLPRSPLGLSNYDALDMDEMYDDEDRDTDDVYTDWNKGFNTQTSAGIMDGDEYDYLEELDGITKELGEPPEERPPPPPDELIVELVKEKERQKELVSSVLSHSAGTFGLQVTHL